METQVYQYYKSNGNSLELDLKILFQVPSSLGGGGGCCFWLHTLTYSHTPLTCLAQGPSSHLYSHSSHKKACRPLYRIHSQHKPPGTIHPPILHIGILDSLRNRSRDQINDLYYHRVPVPFWDRHPARQWASTCGSGAGHRTTEKSAGLGMKNSWTTG